ncbi:PIK3R4 kinase-related protein [Toxoplasma gondii MAS]|uniref:PIK3R4 kinase-related protein n=1 Tax=Toxoplasma gondii MAS TaxID=943118 RepID=A0A086QT76_TOXGO|nr:PIK3R4 kinase-related protein [Toxoplasma gondii MAS]
MSDRKHIDGLLSTNSTASAPKGYRTPLGPTQTMSSPVSPLSSSGPGGQTSKLYGSSTFSIAQNNAAMAAAQAAHSAGLKVCSQSRGGGSSSSSTGASASSGSYQTARATPPSLSSVLLNSPLSHFAASRPSTPQSPAPLGRRPFQSFTHSSGAAGTGNGSPSSVLPSARLSPSQQSSPQFRSPLSGAAGSASTGTGIAAVASRTSLAGGKSSARPAETSSASGKSHQTTGNKAPMLASGSSVHSRSGTKHADADAKKKASLATSWYQVVCESAAVEDGKVRSCCCSAPIQPSVLQGQPQQLEARVVYSNTKAIIRGVEDATRPGLSSQVFLNSTNPDWDAHPSLAVETLHLDKLLQSAIYGAVFRASLHTTRAKRRSDKSAFNSDGLDGKKSGDDIGVETMSEVVAVKVLSLTLQLNASPSLQEDFLSELKFYPYLKNHPNILTPSRVYVDSDQQLLFLVFPFAEYEDLFEVLKKRKQPFTEGEVRWMCRQLFEAVYELHKRGVAMRDLSLENVLIFRCPRTGQIIPKITDPGQAVIACPQAAALARASASTGDSRRAENVTDPGHVLLPPDKIFGKSFRPPEVYRQCRYDPYKVDSFCLGWMVYYLLTKHQLFQRAVPSDENWRLLASKDASDLLELLGKKNGAVLSVDGLDFAVQLLEENPSRRLSIRQALRHPFMTGKVVTPVYADSLFPNDPLAQQQHLLKQQHHRQLHLERQQRVQQQLAHQRKLRYMQQEHQRFLRQEQERRLLHERALQLRYQARKAQSSEEVASTAPKIVGSSASGLTLKPSAVKQEQRAGLPSNRQTRASAASREGSPLRTSALQRSASLKRTVSAYKLRAASREETQVKGGCEQHPENARSGVAAASASEAGAKDKGQAPERSAAGLRELSASRTGTHRRRDSTAVQSRREGGETTLEFEGMPSGARKTEATDSREAVAQGAASKFQDLSTSKGNAPASDAAVGQSANRAELDLRPSATAEATKRMKGKVDEKSRTGCADLRGARRPSSRSTDSGSTSAETCSCCSDSDSSSATGDPSRRHPDRACGTEGHSKREGTDGPGDAKKKPAAVGAGAKTDHPLQGLKLRKSGSSKKSGRDDTHTQDTQTCGNIVCARGSLALAASTVPAVVSSEGTWEPEPDGSFVSDDTLKDERADAPSLTVRVSKAKDNCEKLSFSSARATVKSPLKHSPVTASTLSLGDSSSGGDAAGTETRRVLATRRSSRQSVAAMIERFQQMTRRSSPGCDLSSPKSSAASNRLFGRVPSPRPTLR